MDFLSEIDHEGGSHVGRERLLADADGAGALAELG